MKGYIIFENFNKIIECKEVIDGTYISEIAQGNAFGTFTGTIDKVSEAKCNEGDKYDFETGALISLMRMVGRDKVIKACDELYKDDNYKNALQEMTENNEKLIEENERLKKEKEQIIVAKNVLYNKLEEENEKLKNESMHRLKDKLDLKEKYVALMAENEKLKLDCEKLQHGYLDTDMMFCVRRGNGKQYKALVALFKKIDQKKVDAAYKEAYNTTLPVWQKEVLKQMYDIYETGKWTKPPTKREEMWANIFKSHKENDVVIKVKREDVNTFLHEIENEIPEITWASGVKIFETKYTIGDIYEELKTCDMLYFRLSKENKLSYSNDPHIYRYRELEHIDYLPPMRWDLFRKGRIAVGIRKEDYDEFILNATENIDSFSKHNPYNDFNYSFFIFDKNAKFIEAIGRSQFRQLKEINNHKVIYWEDVR